MFKLKLPQHFWRNSILLGFACLLMIGISGCADPCKKVSCQNGGTCSDGDCSCKSGFSGNECQNEKTPIKIIVNKIDVLQMPPIPPSGGGWDASNGPDIYLVFKQGSSILLDSDYVLDADVNSGYSWTLSPSIEITSPTSQCEIDLRDYDSTSANDFMGGYYFTPWDMLKGNKFPSTLTIEGTPNLKFKLYVSYVF